MHILTLDQIRERIDDVAVIDRMRDALTAQSRGECDTPMPMHLSTPNGGEVHMKSSYRRGGKYFAFKMASTFGGVGNGMMMLASADTGEPVALLQDQGHLTDVRTAAVAAIVARELGRSDHSIAILGSGIQARLTARFHARVLPLKRVYLWGRNRERTDRCADEIRKLVPEVIICATPWDAAASVKFVVTCTAACEALLKQRDLQEGTHISAVGSDSQGKQELDPEILRSADLLLADSIAQCEKLGELQHVPDQLSRAIEIGTFCQAPGKSTGSSVADFTGLGVEDLFIAEMIFNS